MGQVTHVDQVLEQIIVLSGHNVIWNRDPLCNTTSRQVNGQPEFPSRLPPRRPFAPQADGPHLPRSLTPHISPPPIPAPSPRAPSPGLSACIQTIPRYRAF